MLTQASSGAFETPQDAGKGAAGTVNLWLEAINLATKEEAGWRKDGAKAIQIYLDRSTYQDNADTVISPTAAGQVYNILYANTETIAPAIYNSVPIPDIRRRFSDPDPVAKTAALLLERAISYSVDQYDFDSVMRAAVKDDLLPGRAVTRVRYKPVVTEQRERVAVVKNEAGYFRASDLGVAEDEASVQTDEQGFYVEGDPYDAVTYEEVCCEHVQWTDFRRGPGKTWDEVAWVAFRHFLTRAELEKLNPEVGKTLSLDVSIKEQKPDDTGNNEAEPDVFKRAVVWEIWDKGTKKVSYVAPSYTDAPLKVEDDPLGLDGFFPIPRPLYAVVAPETLVPVPLYKLYEDQADELNEISIRLTRLTRACKAVGVYGVGGGDNTMQRLKDATDGDLVPVQEAMQFAAQGGIANFIWEKDINTVSSVIERLSFRQEQVKNNIFEIMGIADILRGASKASETATAQDIKAQWGSLRLQQMQADVQRYARDLFRLMAEVVANKFSRETLVQMTGVPLPLMAEKQMLMQAAAADPRLQAKAQEMGPAWEEVEPVLRSDAIRSFRIDIETDSTVQADVGRRQQNLTQFIAGVGQFVQSVGPAIQSGALPMEFAKTFLKAAAREFKLPREAQDSLENLQPVQPNAAQAEAEQAKLQAEQARTQADMQKTQVEAQIAQQKAQFEAASMQMDMQARQQEHQFKMTEMAAQHEYRMAELAAKAAQPSQPTIQ